MNTYPAAKIRPVPVKPIFDPVPFDVNKTNINPTFGNPHPHPTSPLIIRDYDFILATPKTGLSGTYWIGIYMPRGTDSFAVAIDNSESGRRHCRTDDAGSSWACSSNTTVRLKMKGCAP